ncbi:MAG: hypothetical protein ACQEQA_02070 [Bacillota bacterium]
MAPRTKAAAAKAVEEAATRLTSVKVITKATITMITTMRTVTTTKAEDAIVNT